MTPRKRLRGPGGKFVSNRVTIPASRPATDQVFEIVELLETILLELPMQDLLLDQRVCKSWHSLITSSIRLRRALFREPVPCGDISYIDWRLDDKNMYTENWAQLELGEHLRGPAKDRAPKTYASHWGKTRDDAGKYRIFVNPLLAKMFPVLSGIYWPETGATLSESAEHPSASWQTMYFTQPPINCMAIEWDSWKEDEDSTADWTLTFVKKSHDGKGMVMGELFARLVSLGKPAWIEGRHLWEGYGGAGDLAKVVVRAAES